MSRLTIVVPCLGDASEFDGTLVSILQNRPASCEVLVAHSRPYDDPYRLSGEVRFLHKEASSLVELINAAVTEATGDIVHVMGCGLEATDQWTVRPLAHFEDPDVASVAPIVISARKNRLVTGGVRWTAGGGRREVTDARLQTQGSGRLRSTVLAPVLTAGFFRREVLVALEGFESEMGDELADVAFGLALTQLGRINVVEPMSQVIEALRTNSPSRGELARGRAIERLFWRHRTHEKLSTTLWHVVEVALDVCRRRSAWGLVGRAATCCELGSQQRYLANLSAARQRLLELTELRTTIQKQRQQRRAA